MLFGHQSDDANQSAATASVAQPTNINPLAVDPATGASLPVAPAPPSAPEPSGPSVLEQLVTPSVDSSITTAPVVEPIAPAAIVTEATPVEAVAAEPAIVPAPIVPLSAGDNAAVTDTPTQESIPTLGQPSADDLLSLKQHALEQLGPLVGQLDLTPEERFRTTMMMIQSTDNQALLPVAYEAAQNIAEEKVRAQALLDIVNEINYFTQPKAA
jgi:hypothetical protein